MKDRPILTSSISSTEALITLLLLAALTFFLCWAVFGGTNRKAEKSKVEALQERYAQSGVVTDTLTRESVSPTEDQKVIPTSKSPEQAEETPNTETVDLSESITKPKVEKEFLVVHSFSIARNASNFEKTLQSHGFETKTAVRSNGWTAVGILFDPTEVNRESLVEVVSTEYDAQPVNWRELEE